MNLEKEGYQILEAENGEHAIKILFKGDNMKKIALILCDVRMPVVNGEEFVNYLQQTDSQAKVVMLTGYPDKKLAELLKEKGVDEYLVKPIEKQTLLKAIKEIISS
jgi:CheY-like chemotaxis protein